ncbi:probable kinetochore protein NDC80 isoform X2 [Sitophilus oryzae]|uniref:Probable kinetochore protein NDC80 isoform X2 n=1 Tax=Sitophilus oryzae TaxID=7048 RepID=A0A6J2YUY4_SITOR|nr:probable kinetochore protein NDC80 isoform X2 [Sitophilus oryzae]
MKVCWKALVGYGFVFWIVLCITDLLGITNVHKYSKEFDELYEKPLIVQNLKKTVEPHLNKVEFRGVKFGWTLLVWNLVTFCISIVICSIGRSVVWSVWEIFRNYKNKMIYSRQQFNNSQYTRIVTSGSKIPIIVRQQLMRSSDTILQKSEISSKVTIDKSCPNLLIRRSGSNLSTATDFAGNGYRSFRHSHCYNGGSGLSTEQQLHSQCLKLKDDLHRLQASSLKEHAVLSRKIDALTKDKREMTKQLTVVQKENRAATQQLEELIEEKATLLKKLETAAKDFKTNTKTKKLALAKLEEVNNNIEDLRQQLEQVTRDKEILEKKLRLLETEYNKLHERYIQAQQNSYRRSHDDNLPERDESGSKAQTTVIEKLSFCADNSIPPTKTVNVLASVSQTEFDMKIIQEKIKQLERNLENLNVGCDNFENYRGPDQLESDLSESIIEPTTDSLNRVEGSRSTFSGYSSNNSPRLKYWSEKVSGLIGNSHNQFSKIHALASRVQEKAKQFGSIKLSEGDSTLEEDSSQSDERVPKRLVSSSIAFKNFLKSLNNIDTVNNQ